RSRGRVARGLRLPRQADRSAAERGLHDRALPPRHRVPEAQGREPHGPCLARAGARRPAAAGGRGRARLNGSVPPGWRRGRGPRVGARPADGASTLTALLLILVVIVAIAALVWAVARWHLGGADLSAFDGPVGERFSSGEAPGDEIRAVIARLGNAD